jgi:hypothetical protein
MNNLIITHIPMKNGTSRSFRYVYGKYKRNNFLNVPYTEIVLYIRNKSVSYSEQKYFDECKDEYYPGQFTIIHYKDFLKQSNISTIEYLKL